MSVAERLRKWIPATLVLAQAGKHAGMTYGLNGYWTASLNLYRKVAAAFKERIYDIGPNESPGQVLIALAENQFGLHRIAAPKRFKGNIVQVMTGNE